MLSRLVDRLRGRYARLDEQDIERAIDIIVEQTDPRLRFVRAYRRKLRKPVVRSLVYADDLIGRIPGPFEVSRKAYGSDPQVNALFGSVDDIDTLFAHSRMLQDFFRDKPGCDLVYVPLIMLRREKRILGIALSGGIVRRDVARTSVNYSEHRLGIVHATCEAELRGELKWRGIHFLAVTALENITRLKAGTAQLEEQRALLKMKLRNMQTQHRGLDALVAPPPSDTQEQQALEQHLEDTYRKLQEARTGVVTLDDYLDQVCRVLNHPSRFLRVKRNSVTVDRMGIKSDAMSHQQGSEVVSATITIGAHPAVEMIMASFQRMDMAATPGGS
ncbi:MAG: hypothetical protein OEU44_01820 [Gammaproteobacteria bacterium]|nr:hypothetical protein [Gammaproteobacteria bacterium]